MPDLISRLGAVPTALVAVVLAAGLMAPAASASAAVAEPPGLDAVMRAVGQVESGGRYTAVNVVSGAYGKYQIMPANWPVWARTYVGDARAPQSPENQEKVARGRFIALYNWLGSWPRVAYWWLTGSTRPVDAWSAKARFYVDKVMVLAGGAGWPLAGAAPGPAAKAADKKGSTPTATLPPSASPPAPIHYGEGDPAIAYRGSWSSASHAGYLGGNVAWSTARGSAATVAFAGRTFAWVGPVGPTRGSAQVYVDDVLIATVSQYAAGFSAQRTIFSRSFDSIGRHTVRIVTVGTDGHPMVAIDELVVGF